MLCTNLSEKELIMILYFPMRIVLLLLLIGSFAMMAASAPIALEAKGFADPRGGRNGSIIRVTNLDAEGPGSLRAALECTAPRIIVFEVGGVVDLKKSTLVIDDPYVTIAGQTAPSPGITLIRGSIMIKTHDVVIKHIRIRPGDAGEGLRSGWETDGITTNGGEAYNVTVDHCSFSWATDENLSASGPRLKGPEATSHKVTFSNCIIAEGLSKSTHSKGEHSKGSLIHDFCRDIAIIGNLYAHNMRRNPYFKAYTTGVIVNNVIYNPGAVAIHLGYSEGEWKDSPLNPENARVSIVGNVLIHGSSTRPTVPLVSGKGDAYMEDNFASGLDEESVPLVSGYITQLEEKSVWPEGLKPIPSKSVVEYITEHAGARPRNRDATDKRIIREFMERKGRVINSQNEVGGYPKTEMTARKLNIPETNIEAWLDTFSKEVE